MQSQTFRGKKICNYCNCSQAAQQTAKKKNKKTWQYQQKKRHPNNEVFEGSDNANLLVEGTNLTGTHNSSACQCSAIKKH